MPKLKTVRSARKRFKLSATGKAISTQANKQHNMRKRSTRQIRVQRGTTTLPEVEARRVRAYMPYA